LASGQGAVFNSGERGMGFTSPLWLLWIWLGTALHADPVRWAQVTSIAADLGTLLVVMAMLRSARSTHAAVTFGLFFAPWPLFAASAVSGLETSAVLLLIAASAWLVERRSRFAGVVLGALAISRPEALVAAVVLSWRA